MACAAQVSHSLVGANLGSATAPSDDSTESTQQRDGAESYDSRQRPGTPDHPGMTQVEIYDPRMNVASHDRRVSGRIAWLNDAKDTDATGRRPVFTSSTVKHSEVQEPNLWVRVSATH